MEARTQGVVLHDGGALGNAAMMDQICVFDQGAATIVGDFDLGQTPEILLDAHTDRAIASSDGIVFELPTSLASATPLFNASPIAARVLDDGVAALIDQGEHCAVVFDTSDTQAVYELEDVACGPDIGFTADRATGTVYIADGRSFGAIESDGSFQFFPEEAADMIAWDSTTGTVLLAQRGGSLLRSANPDGTINWGVEVAGAVHALSMAETQGLATVMVDDYAGGELIVIDAATGEQLVSHLTPDLADVTFSSDGLSMGIIQPDAVYLYTVDPDMNPMATPTSAQAADLGMVIGTGSAVGGSLLAAASVAVFIE